MILRGLEIHHWRCLGHLRLTNLSSGITIIHGPNRTGKTSLVRALRGCLYDLAPTSSGQKMDCNRPLGGEGPTKVIVDFATGGHDYRLTKVFASRAAGKGILEQKSGDGWLVLEKAPQEAHRKVHEILGADQSSAGLNQLLWLTQGEVALPDPKDLTGDLKNRLNQVLGVLVTGRDLHFKDALAERLKRWYTAGGKERAKSPLADLREQIEAKQEEFKQRQTQWQNLEGAVRNLQTLQEMLPLRRREARDAEESLKKLRDEKDRTQNRIRLYEQAKQQLERAVGELDKINEQVKECRRLTLVLTNQEKEEERLQKEEGLARQESKRLEDQLEIFDRQVMAARQGEKEHAKGSEAINDRRALLALVDKKNHLDQLLAELAALSQDAAKLEADVQKTLAPDVATLKSLRDNRKETGILEAELKAAELTIQVRLHQSGTLALALDDQAETVAVAIGDQLRRTARQRASLELPGVFTLRLGRARDNLTIEDQYRRLAELNHAFQDVVRSFGENPEEESCLDRLAVRKTQLDGWLKQLDEKRKSILAKAPKGRGIVEAEANRLAQQRAAILERRENLAAWTPNQADIDAQENDFQKVGLSLQNQRAELDKELGIAREEQKKAAETWAVVRQQLAAVQALIETHRQDLARRGDPAEMDLRLERAQSAHDQAIRLVAEHELTEAEKTIDERCLAAEKTVNLRNERLREANEQQNNLRVEVGDHHGLHAALADVEAAQNALEAQLAAEELEANAHRLLDDLFRQARKNQVENVMGPVAQRVEDWVRIAGLDGIAEVRFGDNFLPDGLHLRQGDQLVPLPVDEESFGAVEQLGLLVRLALGGVLANQEPVVAVLDDPLAHADLDKHRRLQDVLRLAAVGNPGGHPPSGPMQIIILTCHPERFDYLPGAHRIDLAKELRSGGIL